MTESKDKKHHTIVFYHSPCREGPLAAGLMYRRFQELGMAEDVLFVPINHDHGQRTLDKIHMRRHDESQIIRDALSKAESRPSVYFVDYIPEDENLFKHIVENASGVFLYDHHPKGIKTAKKFAHHAHLHNLCSTHSSATDLVCRHFLNMAHKDMSKGARIISWFDRQKLGTTKDAQACSRYIDSFMLGNMEEALTLVDHLSDLSHKEIVERGKALLKADGDTFVNFLLSADIVEVEAGHGHKVRALMIHGNNIDLPRDITPFLIKAKERNQALPSLLLMWYRENDHVKVAARCLPHENIALRVAAHAHGGGHPTNAKFGMDAEVFFQQHPGQRDKPECILPNYHHARPPGGETRFRA